MESYRLTSSRCPLPQPRLLTPDSLFINHTQVCLRAGGWGGLLNKYRVTMMGVLHSQGVSGAGQLLYLQNRDLPLLKSDIINSLQLLT